MALIKNKRTVIKKGNRPPVTKTPGTITLSANDNQGNTKFALANYITGRPPLRTKFDIADWRNALIYAEMLGGTRVPLYDLYNDILLDAHITSQWEKRIMGITNTDMLFTTADGKEIPEMQEMMDSPEFEAILTEVMQTVGWGITVMELENQTINQLGKQLQKVSVFSVPRKHIRPKEGVIVKEQYDSAENGLSYRTGPYANYVAEIGKPDDLGLILKAVPYVLLKRGDVGDWAQFVQLFGMPFREYRYNGYDPATEAIIKKNAEEMGSAPYIILPDGAQITLHEVKGAGVGGGEVYQKLADFCDKMISILILGNTLTTDNTNVGSNALGNVHQATEDDIKVADKKHVRRILNTIIKPILFNLGWPVKDGNFAFKEEEDVAGRQAKVSLLTSIKNAGAPIADEQLYEHGGIEKPKNYDELKQKQVDEAAAKNAVPPAPGKKEKKPGDKKDKKLSADDDTWINKFRIMLADFFDPAP